MKLFLFHFVVLTKIAHLFENFVHKAALGKNKLRVREYFSQFQPIFADIWKSPCFHKYTAAFTSMVLIGSIAYNIYKRKDGKFVSLFLACISRF